MIWAYVRAWHQHSHSHTHTYKCYIPFCHILKTHAHDEHIHSCTHNTFTIYTFCPIRLWPVHSHTHILSSIPSENLLLSQLTGRFYNAVARVSVYLYTCTDVCMCMYVYLGVCVNEYKRSFYTSYLKCKEEEKSSRLLTGCETVWLFKRTLHVRKTLSHIDCTLSKLNTRANPTSRITLWFFFFVVHYSRHYCFMFSLPLSHLWMS